MDELLLSRIRLAIVTELLALDWASFGELQRSLDVTAGNMTIHLAKLVSGGYIDEEKRFVGRRPNTRYRLTARGRSALLEHVAMLNDMVKSASSRSDSQRRGARRAKEK
jgi:DNA-binding transcriptional ArsR family regulator